MTDNEIIKALECCCSQDGSVPCLDCPCWVEETDDCVGVDWGAVTNLINRQKAEIDSLQKRIQEGIDLAKQIPEMVSLAQAEAIKEFAERLHEKLYTVPTVYNAHFGRMTDSIVKEMVGEGE